MKRVKMTWDTIKSWRLSNSPLFSLIATTLLLNAIVASGCKNSEEVGSEEKQPRPVRVATLTSVAPPESTKVTASVSAWKTEDIGFEVSGRVKYVAEPNSPIEGRVFDNDGNLLLKGTPVAAIESERYELQVESANSSEEQAIQGFNATLIELDSSIPAQIRAAQAELNLAEIELERSESLLAQSAGSKSDVQRNQANLENAKSKLQQLEAAEKAKVAELDSMFFKWKQSKQSLRDAKRNLEDCTLFSSFGGEIADTFVVPGSVVTAGQPVATVQMMNPIKLEVEVNAEVSRTLSQRSRVDVFVGNQKDPKVGYLYLIDPIADPQTRTYTATILLKNEKRVSVNQEPGIPTTKNIWQLDFEFLPGSENGLLFATEKSIRQDKDGHFVWLVDNVLAEQKIPQDHRLKVSKLRIIPKPLKIPFLGNWVFQNIELVDKAFDFKDRIFVGDLTVPEGEDKDKWAGDTIYLDEGDRWMLRPGDLAKVDLSLKDVQEGYFVPMDAIVREGSRKYLFLIDESGENQPKVEQVEIRLLDGTENQNDESNESNSTEASVDTKDQLSSLMRVEAVPGENGKKVSLEGRKYVVKGTHYLRAGEVVKVVE